MKRHTAAEMSRMKASLYIDLAKGAVDIREASRRMRRILGMNQKDMPEKWHAYLHASCLNSKMGQAIRPWRLWRKSARPLALK